MLRRTVSQPIGLDRVDQLGTCISYTSMQNLTAVFARSRSSLLLDSDCTPIFHGQEHHHWENEELGWQPTGRCRALEYEGPDHDAEIKVSEECDDVYTAEEEEVWNSAELSLEEKRDIVELLHCKNHLMKRNADLQKALDVCEDSNTHLEMENSALRTQIKCMKQSIQDAEQLMKEMDTVRGALAESETAISSLKACISKLEKENKALINQIDTIANEISQILPERELDKEKITNLNQHIKVLQQKLEKTRIQLDEKTAEANSKDVLINQLKACLDEFATMEQTLKTAVKELEGQLELARVSTGVSLLNSDGTVLTTTKNCFSLAEELGLLPGLPESDDEVEVSEPYKVEEERKIMVKEEETMKVEEETAVELDENKVITDVEKVIRVEEEIVEVSDEPITAEEKILQGSRAILEDQREVHREINFEKEIEGVKFEDVIQDIVREMQEVAKFLNEEDAVKNKQTETEEEEQIISCVEEQGDKAQHSSAYWLGEPLHSFGRGVLAASAFSLGIMLPLSMVSAAMPPYHSGSGLGCFSYLWNTARQVLEPYCTVQNMGMPPF